MVPGSVTVITGISGAGKSTVADLLARRFERGVHVRGDLFRRMVVTGREEMRPGAPSEAFDQLHLRYEIATTVADRYASAQFTVVLQDIFLGRALGQAVTRLTARPRYVVVLAPRTDIVAQREAAREKVAYRPSEYDIEALDASLRDETPRIGLWLDSSAFGPDETVDEILRLAHDARIDDDP
jgi:cytidylate kinase